MLIAPHKVSSMIADVMFTASKQPNLQGLFEKGSYPTAITAYRKEGVGLADKNLVYMNTPLRILKYAWGSSDLIPLHKLINVVRGAFVPGANAVHKPKTLGTLMLSNQRADDNPEPLSFYGLPDGYYIGKWQSRECDNFAGFILDDVSIQKNEVQDEPPLYTRKEYTLMDLTNEVIENNIEFNLGRFDYDQLEENVEYLLCDHSDEYFAPLLHSETTKKQLTSPQTTVTVVGYNTNTFRNGLPFYLYHNGSTSYVTEYEIEYMRLRFEMTENGLDVACYTRIVLKEAKMLTTEAYQRTLMMSKAII